MAEDDKQAQQNLNDNLSENTDSEDSGTVIRRPNRTGAKIQTSMLNMPDDALPMTDRDPQPNAPMLTEGWAVIFKIGDKKKVLPIDKNVMIGRAVEGESADGVLNFDLTDFGAYHFGVSRNHAKLTFSDGYVYLEDLGSTNGTRINGFQLTADQKYRLRDGDEIEFARLRSDIVFKAPNA
ncbi:MAG: FHA domain-containing protein [Chloroflexota bacterium]